MNAVKTSATGSALDVSSGAVRMTVDPTLGARILGFELEGTDILLNAAAVAGTENANNFGATFWPSPQAAWGWPPVAAIDSEPYRVIRQGQELVLQSPTGILLGGERIELTKTFRAVSEQSAIDVIYQMKNVGDTAATLAGWQIARVRKGGLTFFRLGGGGVSGDKLATVTAGGVQWYQYQSSGVTMQGQKTFADGAGWLSHVEQDLILIQAFPDVPQGCAAEGEAEVELYADPSHTYVEIEPQSRVAVIEPGAQSEPWAVRWWLRRLPRGMQATVGNSGLVEFVEAVVRS